MELQTFLKNFAEMLDETAPELIQAETNFRELGEWDSMTALLLVAMVDEQYSVKLTGDDIKKSRTIKDLFVIVNSKN
jgi:acyl carrier protein